MMDRRNEGQSKAMGRPPQKLSTHQQAVLIQVLLTFPDERVGVCCASAGDTREYADGFLIIFKAIDWSVDDLGVMDGLPAVESGLAVLVQDHELPPSAEAFRDALRIYRIEAEIVTRQAGICGSRNFVLAVS
jgi:hypothetical protein